MTQEEKEKIDYEIQARKKAREQEIWEWIKAAFWAIIIIAFVFAVITH